MSSRTAEQLTARRVIRAIALASALAAAVLAVPTPAFAAPPPPATFHWSGADATAADNHNWSDPANWSEGQAPQPRQTVALVFPPLPCLFASYPTPSCSTSFNDVSGLTVSSISVTSPGTDGAADAEEYYLYGAPIRLAGPLTSTGDRSTGSGVAPVHFAFPIQLLSGPGRPSDAGLWTLDGSFNYFDSSVTGARLALVETAGASAEILANVEVAKFAVRRDATSYTYVFGSKLNYDNGHQVKFKHTNLYMEGQFGPLETKDVDIQLEASDFGTPQINLVNGAATFDPDSVLFAERFAKAVGCCGPPVAGRDYPALQATGTVSLANMRLVPRIDCYGVDAGTKFPFILAPSIVGQLDDASGNPIPDGATISTSNFCANGYAPDVQINYVAGTDGDSVVLTVLG